LINGLTAIVEQLERQKSAIDKALAALMELERIDVPPPTRPAPGKAEVVQGTTRRSLGQKKRWAAKKAVEPAPVKAVRNGGMTPDGRKKLADAMKKRWAVKRSGSEVAATKKGPGRPKKTS
jgi:hypothetical protein